MAVRAVLLTLALLLCASGQAAAESSLIPIAGRTAVSGPALAGDAVVWGHQVGNRYDVVIQRGRTNRVLHVRPAALKHAFRSEYYAALEASERRIILSLTASTCADRKACADPFKYVTRYRAALTAAIGANHFTRLSKCTSSVDVSADVVAYSGCDRVLHVRDFAPGAAPAGRDYQNLGGGLRLAGSYLGVRNNASGETLVTNWRTGEDAYSVETSSFDLQSDGKLASHRYTSDGRYQLVWASPSEPFLHALPADLPSYSYYVRIAQDRIASATDAPDSAPSYGWFLDAFDLTGTDLGGYGDNGVVRGSGMDFDGSRLTWMSGGCVATWLVVQDLNATPPDVPQPPCPFPTIVRGSPRVVGAKQRLRLELECPQARGQGCLGSVLVAAVGSPTDYAIRASRRVEVKVRTGGKLCRKDRGHVAAKLFFTWPPYNDPRWPYEELSKTLTIRDRTHHVAACHG